MKTEQAFPVQKTDEEWRRIVTPAQYAVTIGSTRESSLAGPMKRLGEVLGLLKHLPQIAAVPDP